MIIIVLTLIGAFLRLYNLNWDNGNFFHPDERNIANAVSAIHFFDQLNPKFFAYGGFSIYLYRFIAQVLFFVTHNNAWISDWGHINVIGRFCSALFSTLTIPAMYILTKSVFDKRTAIFAAFLTTFTVSFIQTAHYGVTESLLTFLGILICFSAILILTKPHVRTFAVAGIILGMAIATKTSALSFIIFPLSAYLFICFRHRSLFLKHSLYFVFLICIAIIVLVIFSPYTFLDWTKFIESMKYEQGVATGTLRVVYTLQFEHTMSYFFQIKNFFWQLGPIAIPSIFSLFFVLFQGVKNKEYKYLIFLSFPIFYFLYVGSWYTKFVRYMVPLLPFLIIAVSYKLTAIEKKLKFVGTIIICFVCIITTLWALSFFHIYTQEQTRITASRWIYAHILPQSKILTEHWDDGLPIPLSSYSPSLYNNEQLTIYEPDNLDKVHYYANKLSNADYIVINSRRLYGTLIHLPEKYPVTSRYYTLLFNEQLGYKKVAEFSSYPSLLGFEINDDLSEESFQVYDHPKVIIFKNTKSLSRETLFNMLQ